MCCRACLEREYRRQSTSVEVRDERLERGSRRIGGSPVDVQGESVILVDVSEAVYLGRRSSL